MIVPCLNFQKKRAAFLIIDALGARRGRRLERNAHKKSAACAAPDNNCFDPEAQEGISGMMEFSERESGGAISRAGATC